MIRLILFATLLVMLHIMSPSLITVAADPPTDFVKSERVKCVLAYGDKADFVTYDPMTGQCELTIIGPGQAKEVMAPTPKS